MTIRKRDCENDAPGFLIAIFLFCLIMSVYSFTTMKDNMIQLIIFGSLALLSLLAVMAKKFSKCGRKFMCPACPVCIGKTPVNL